MKSNRVPISRCAWSTALRTSWRSTSETTSKLGMRESSVCQRDRPRAVRSRVDNRGSMPEWPKGADCKSAGIRLRRFECPTRPTAEQTVDLPAQRLRARFEALPGPRTAAARAHREIDRLVAQSISCMTATSSQRLNLRPTSRSMPTSSKPQLACSARDASPLASMRADHRVEARLAGDVDQPAEQQLCRCPRPVWSRWTYTESSTVVR